MKRRTALALLLAGVAAGVVAGPLALPQAARAADGPTVPVAALNAGLLTAMQAGRKTPFADRARALGPVIEQAFDLDGILAISVGPRWKSVPAARQADLAEAFRRYTVASYVSNFDGFSGERFEILPEVVVVGADRVVATRIVPASGAPTRLDYVMRAGPTGWRAVDVLVDGTISRAAVQRSDFRSLIGNGDATPLLERLRAKTASLEAGGRS